MSKLIQINKTHLYFWVISLIIILIGLKDINDPNANFDINVHDTYFVIHNFYAAEILASIFFLLGLGYWIMNKINAKLVTFFSIIHSIVTIGSFLIYWIILFFTKAFYTEYELLYMTGDLIDNITIIFIIANVIAQPLYIINILIGLIRKLNNAIA